MIYYNELKLKFTCNKSNILEQRFFFSWNKYPQWNKYFYGTITVEFLNNIHVNLRKSHFTYTFLHIC